ncbi:uncharacterized protein LOC134529780 [Bacillus rossius redtenbacheri]|uniref:uncharacterized protein LOC134529780 n=1 Tax=Bacillus rossius redtenbacheri TaxID=93214 RepID=UPI002FDD88EA
MYFLCISRLFMAKMVKEFSPEEDELLIEEVANHPSIFDTSSPLYRDKNMKDNAWTDISAKVGRSDDECKWRWKNIRDTYNKRQRKGKSVTGSSASAKNKWHLSVMLQFLDHVQFKRKSTTNLDKNTEDDSSADFPEIRDNSSQRVDTFTDRG